MTIQCKKTHKRRESTKRKNLWVQPGTIKVAFQLLSLVDLIIRIVAKVRSLF